jgi:hypothetical protein
MAIACPTSWMAIAQRTGRMSTLVRIWRPIQYPVIGCTDLPGGQGSRSGLDVSLRGHIFTATRGDSVYAADATAPRQLHLRRRHRAVTAATPSRLCRRSPTHHRHHPDSPPAAVGAGRGGVIGPSGHLPSIRRSRTVSGRHPGRGSADLLPPGCRPAGARLPPPPGPHPGRTLPRKPHAAARRRSLDSHQDGTPPRDPDARGRPALAGLGYMRSARQLQYSSPRGRGSRSIAVGLNTPTRRRGTRQIHAVGPPATDLTAPRQREPDNCSQACQPLTYRPDPVTLLFGLITGRTYQLVRNEETYKCAQLYLKRQPFTHFHWMVETRRHASLSCGLL